MRDELHRAIDNIYDDEFTEFYFRYVSEDNARFDLENILTYNVGVKAFRKLHPHHLVMERSFNKPETDRAELSQYSILQEYDTIIPGERMWTNKELLAFWDTTLDPMRTDTKPATIWYKIKTGYFKAVQKSDDHAHLGIKLKLVVPNTKKIQLFSVLKSLIDGTMASFDDYNGSELEEVSERLSISLKIEQQVVMKLLMDGDKAVFNPTRFVYPYRSGVMWNPADDRLVHIDLEIAESNERDVWEYSGELFVVQGIEMNV
ncbi:hypothetical protein D3C73_1016100 [compost metagenome]